MMWRYTPLLLALLLPSPLFASSTIYHTSFTDGLEGFLSDGATLSPTSGSEWSTYSNNEGVVLPNAPGDPGPPYGGHQHVMLMKDTVSNSTYSLNEAILAIDLSEWCNIGLDFQTKDIWDEEHNFPSGNFTGHTNADGIAISDDGTNWTPLWNAADHDGQWEDYWLDISYAAGIAGLSTDGTFYIKFQQYDNKKLNDDGRAWDNILVHGDFKGGGTPVIPEPSTLSLFALGLVGLAGGKRLRMRRKK